MPVIDQIRTVAYALSTDEPELGPARALLSRLENELLSHERADETVLMPLVARALGSESVAAMSRTHAEIEHQIVRVHRLVTELDNETAQPEDIVELRRILYGLYAVLQLHNAQEEEGAFSLVPSVTV